MTSLYLLDGKKALDDDATSISWDHIDDKTHSLLDYVEENALRLREDYLSWLHDFAENNHRGQRLRDYFKPSPSINLWWMSLLIESSVYKSPLSDLLRVIALCEILEREKPTTLVLVSHKTWLKKILKGFCKQQGISLICKKPQRDKGHRGAFSYKRLPVSLRALLSFARLVKTRLKFDKSAKQRGRSFKDESQLFFCSYFFNFNKGALEQGRFESSYWGELPVKVLEKGYRSNWLQLPVNSPKNPSIKESEKAFLSLNKSLQSKHQFLDAFFSLGMAVKVLRDWLTLQGRRIGLIGSQAMFNYPIKGLNLWPLLKEDWQSSLFGPACIDNLFWCYLFDSAISALPPQKAGFYLCENQGWERALISAWKTHQKSPLYAVLHASVRFWDLRLFLSHKTTKDETKDACPQADFTLINGEAALHHFQAMNYPSKRLVAAEALRFLAPSLKSHQTMESLPMLKVIVLGDFVASITKDLVAKSLEAISQQAQEITVCIKPHPNSPVKEEDFPNAQFTVSNQPLDTIISDYDVAIASFLTSAAVDAYLAGLKVFVLMDNTELNFSPLRQQQGVQFVRSTKELSEGLAILKPDQKKETAAQDFFYRDPALTKWNQILKEIE